MSENDAEPTTPATTHLTVEQLTRAEALGEARRVLAARGMVASSAVDATDVHSLACYIVDGGDPWRTYSSHTPENAEDPAAALVRVEALADEWDAIHETTAPTLGHPPQGEVRAHAARLRAALRGDDA